MLESSILTKSMTLVDLVTQAQAPLTLAEITDISGLPRSSVHRLLVLLRDAEVLAHDPERRTYGPGPRLMRWGVRTGRSHNIASAAAPHMKALCRETGQRVALSVLDAHAVLFIHTEEPGSPFRLAPRVGEHSPLHATAAGKLFLAGMSDAARDELLANYAFERCTEFTVTDATSLIAQIEQVRRRGFAVSLREEFRQIAGIAVPVRDRDGRILAALSLWSVYGDEDDIPTSMMADLPRALQAAADIRAGLGHGGA